MQRLIVIQGPTASGKTALGVAVARHFQTAVISADSRQFYREMAIGTAKPTPEEMDGVPHYFIDSHSIHEPLTAGQFEKEAMALIENELSALNYIVVVGGSGMFVDALCKGLDEIPTDPEIQTQVRTDLETKGLDFLLKELEEKDPEYYAFVDKQNTHRILRAIEVIRFTGKPFSEQRLNTEAKRPFESIYFHIDLPRELLYDRINKRVDIMMERGLEEEVKALLPFRDNTSLQTVGYKELFDYFDGQMTLDQAIDKIKQHTRNYAKRQMTWIRRNPDSVALHPHSSANTLDDILRHVENQPAIHLE